MRVRCGQCDWQCSGTKWETLVQTLKHYNRMHSVQGWIYRKYRTLRSDANGSDQ